MKKTAIIFSLALALIFGGSCKKNSDQLITPSSNTSATESAISVKNDRLIFNQEYYQSLSDSSEELDNIKKKIAELNFQSIEESGPSEHCRMESEEVDSLPDFIKSIVNADGIVQIGSHIMKLNFEKEQVFVLNTKYENEINDLLSENVNNAHIEVYKMDEDVLTELENRTARTSLFCTQSGAPSNSTGGTIQCIGKNDVTVLLKYEKFGVWFELNVDIRTGNNNDKRSYILSYVSRTQQKCKSVVSKSGKYTTETNDKVVEKQYSGTTGLHSYYLEAAVYCNQANCNYYYGTLSH